MKAACFNGDDVASTAQAGQSNRVTPGRKGALEMEATGPQANEVSAAEGHGHGASARPKEELDDTESARHGCGISGSVADRHAHQNASTAPVTMSGGAGTPPPLRPAAARGARGTLPNLGVRRRGAARAPRGGRSRRRAPR